LFISASSLADLEGDLAGPGQQLVPGTFRRVRSGRLEVDDLLGGDPVGVDDLLVAMRGPVGRQLVLGQPLELDGGRSTIQLRETPGNLSGSESGTHQDFSPADANCCHSLLLDPDARMGIDLHKRLFLLVIGRGE
jgi:hypothetical protein